MNALGAIVQNLFLNRNRYRVHQDAVIIACFYNPQGNPYRLIAFQKWYRSIKHLPHRIVECLVGPNAKSQLPTSPYISQVRSDTLVWHKEALLNKLIRELPKEFKYVFWLDTDILFTNLNWLTEGVQRLRYGAKVIQPFEYCIHLKKNQFAPDFDVNPHRRTNMNLTQKDRHPQLWRSFCSNSPTIRYDSNYDTHGHVGFAWGARREVLDACPLYDRALIGGADHIIAHAAAGHYKHPCIRTAFADSLNDVALWSQRFDRAVRGAIDYVPGDVYHIWHGNISARDYLKRIKEFTGTANEITERDTNGLAVASKQQQEYVKRYFTRREATSFDFDTVIDEGFAEDMGYALADLIITFGQATYSDPILDEPRLGDHDNFKPVSVSDPTPIPGSIRSLIADEPPFTAEPELEPNPEDCHDTHEPTGTTFS